MPETKRQPIIEHWWPIPFLLLIGAGLVWYVMTPVNANAPMIAVDGDLNARGELCKALVLYHQPPYTAKQLPQPCQVLLPRICYDARRRTDLKYAPACDDAGPL